MWFFKSCIGHTRSVSHLSPRRHVSPRRMMARMTRALMGQMLLLPQSIDRTKSGGSVTQWLCPLADTSSVWDQAQPMQLNWCSKKSKMTTIQCHLKPCSPRLCLRLCSITKPPKWKVFSLPSSCTKSITPKWLGDTSSVWGRLCKKSLPHHVLKKKKNNMNIFWSQVW